MGNKEIPKSVPISIWCPNCGIPRNSKITLKKAMKKTKEVKFFCRACGFGVFFSKQGAKKKDAGADNKQMLNDLISVASVGKKISKVI